jgi:serine phosphatase RsbU (regulator of sigma subunit)
MMDNIKLNEQSPKKNILIIDDDDIVSRFLSLILRDNYTVNNYTNAEDAIRNETLYGSDLIITDVNLPGISGIELLGKIREIDPCIPVVVITGINDIDIAISALKNGAFDFILKPFKNDQILLSIEKGLERRRLLLENISLMNELKNKNSQLEILNERIQSRNYEIERELDIASNLQQCLFPIVFPEVRDFKFDLRYKPVEKISGDFFDFIIYDEENFSFFFGDVSGHGVPAALYSAMVKSGISSLSGKKLSPAKFIKEMNRFLICSQSKMSYNYATIFYGIFNLTKGLLTYCNGGIPPPVIIRRDHTIIQLKSTGPFVGIFNSSRFDEETINIERGDRYIFYTDGAFECTDNNEVILGQSTFLEIIKKIKKNNIQDIVRDLFDKIEDYCVPSGYTDDLTILGMDYLIKE